MVSTTLLSTNEIIGMGAVEIVSIPDIFIVSGKYPDSQAMATKSVFENKGEIQSLIFLNFLFFPLIHIPQITFNILITY